MTEITIADATPRVQYAVTTPASTGPFSIPWPYWDPSTDIRVWVDDTELTYTTEFTVAGTSVDDGYSDGEVTLITGVTDSTITVMRDIPAARSTDFPSSGNFDISALNVQLDKLYAIQQQIEETIGRCIKLSETVGDSVSGTLPTLADEETMAWDAATNAFVAGPTVTDIEDAATNASAAASSATDAQTAETAAETAQGLAEAAQAAAEAVESSLTLPTAVADSFLRRNAGNTAYETKTASEVKTAIGAGDASGPGSSTDNSVMRFDGTGGKTAQDSGVTIDDDDNLYGHGAGLNAQVGTTYTLTATDNGKVVTLNNASAITLTVPQTSTEALAAGFQCAIVQLGAGQVTVAKEGSDTIASKDSNLKLTGQYSAGTIVKLTAGSPNAWFLGGDLDT